MTYVMRAPCVGCGSTDGYCDERNGQTCVFCGNCGRFAYNAPKRESGLGRRRVADFRSDVKASQRSRVLIRAGGQCELCGTDSAHAILHVGHLLSVADAALFGLTAEQIASDENLAAMCESCNLGLGRVSVTARLYVALLIRRATLADDGENQTAVGA